MRRSSDRYLGVGLLIMGLVALLLLALEPLGLAAPSPLRVLLGWGAYLTPVLFLSSLALLIWGRHRPGWQIRWTVVASGELLVLLLLVASHLLAGNRIDVALAGRGGGLVGWAGSEMLTGLLGSVGSWVLVIAASAVTIWLLLRALPASNPLPRSSGWSSALMARARGGYDAIATRSPFDWVRRAGIAVWEVLRSLSLIPGNGAVDSAPAGHGLAAPDDKAGQRAPSPKTARPRSSKASPAGSGAVAAGGQELASPPTQPAKTGGRLPPPKPRPTTLPPFDLLKPDQPGPGAATGAKQGGVASANADARQRAQVLKDTLAEFGVPVEIVSIKEGPTVTQFGVEPGEVVRELRNGEVQRRRVSVHSILRLSNDLALALAAHPVRIEAPVPGRPYVGIEVPNSAKTFVSLRSVLESRGFAKIGSPLSIALGRDVSGDPVAADLTAMPHLLIAGATGSGKSVCINAIVCALLMNNGPESLRFVMVDPKLVELPVYNGIPHLIGSVITDPAQVTGALAWLTLQMDDRYRVFSDSGVRNIAQYNRKVFRSRSVERMPYIVLVIDELADLMMTAAYDTERQICRLAQMARATGIHLVLATQRPSVDVVTGLIKANFPARIAFAVTTQVDSRVVLDTPGAEKLLGRGDMLLMTPDSAKLTRVQGCWVSDSEIEGVVNFWKAGLPEAEATKPVVAPWSGYLEQPQARDELLEQALQMLQTKSTISASMLQRQLRIGFPRAARLMEQLEEMGAVGPDEGGGRSRQVLFQQEDTAEVHGL